MGWAVGLKFRTSTEPEGFMLLACRVKSFSGLTFEYVIHPESVNVLFSHYGKIGDRFNKNFKIGV